MTDWQSAKSIYEFSAKDIDGNEVSLEKYRYIMSYAIFKIPPTMYYIKCCVKLVFLSNCFSSTRGHVCVIVNVASKWGKTKVNYTQLVEMHASYAEKGLHILGFPCNQFANQVSKRLKWWWWLCLVWNCCYLGFSGTTTCLDMGLSDVPGAGNWSRD